jgi:hypothetical protein
MKEMKAEPALDAQQLTGFHGFGLHRLGSDYHAAG